MSKSDRNGSFEVHATRYWLTVVLRTIDEMLNPLECGWPMHEAGFDYELQNRSRSARESSEQNDRVAHIRPVGWPEQSFIAIRLMRMEGHWCPVEGGIYAIHFKEEGLHYTLFKWHSGSPCFITPRGEGTSGSKLIAEAVARRRPNLVGSQL